MGINYEALLSLPVGGWIFIFLVLSLGTFGLWKLWSKFHLWWSIRRTMARRQELDKETEQEILK